MTFLCFSQNLNYAIGWTVVHSLWQAFIITLIVGVALLILQKKTSKIRYMVSNLGLWAILLSAFVTFVMYYDFSRQPGEFVFIPDTSAISNPLSENANPNINAELPQYNPVSTYSSLSWKGMKDYCNQNMYLIVSLWFMGVVIFILKILGSISYVYYLRNRMNFPADEYWQETLDAMRKKINVGKYVELVESALVRSPIVVGHLKPMILFPIGAINRLDSHEVEAILAHELAHVMRHDYFFNILQNVIEALFYFHPAVWWLSSQIRTERENCCDDVAISICGNAMTYAKSLVSVQEMAYYSPNLAMAFAGTSKKKHLLLRVQRILNQPKSTINIMEKVASTGILLLVLVAFAFGGNRFNENTILLGNSNAPLTQNNDNQTLTSSKKAYLKYDKNGELDSLPVDKHVADGNYSFVNNLYNVDMTVKNQHVITFKINGLEVNKKDMPKFEKMINGLVSNKDEEIENTLEKRTKMASRHNETQTIMKQADGSDAIVSYNEKGIYLVVIQKPHREAITINYNKNENTIYLGGKKASLKAVEKLGWTINNKGLQPINGFFNVYPGEAVSQSSVSTPSYPERMQENYDEAAIQEEINELLEKFQELRGTGVKVKEAMEAKRNIDQAQRMKKFNSGDEEAIREKLEEARNQLDSIADEIESENQEDNEEGASICNSSKNDYYSNQKACNFDKSLESELINDGYIKSTKYYTLSWNTSSMKVNGKRVADNHRRKYEQMHKKITGSSLGNDFSITKTVSNDD